MRRIFKKFGIEAKGCPQVRCFSCKQWFSYNEIIYPHGIPCPHCGVDDRIIKNAIIDNSLIFECLKALEDLGFIYNDSGELHYFARKLKITCHKDYGFDL